MTSTPTLPTDDVGLALKGDSAELFAGVLELLGDARRHLLAGELGMLHDNIVEIQQLIDGGADAARTFDAVAEFTWDGYPQRVPLRVSAMTRQVALLKARAEIIAMFELPDTHHVRVLLDAAEVNVDG